MKNEIQIFAKKINTPLGLMLACATKEGLCLLQFEDCQNLDKDLNFLKKKFNSIIQEEENKHLSLLDIELKEYFEGLRKEFTIPLCIFGTNFQLKSYKELQNIPYGNTISYKDQALALNKSKAYRAVANANAKNKIAILIPCHRVIGENGKLRGYSGKVYRKQALLELENQFRS